MSLRFCSLASGSRGNALLVESADTLILLDCGVSLRILDDRMRAVGRSPEDIDAILITHEHSDHISGLPTLLRRVQRPVWSTHGTAKSLSDLQDHRIVRYGADFTVGDIRVHPFPVPHDAREPAQYRFEAAGLHLGVMTDTGHISAHVRRTMADVDALAIEFNHDLDRLMNGTYPDSLKARVGSDFGHLNNHQAADLVSRLDHARLRWVVALHMSQQNNTPADVDSALADVLANADFDFRQASQAVPTGWFELA